MPVGTSTLKGQPWKARRTTVTGRAGLEQRFSQFGKCPDEPQDRGHWKGVKRWRWGKFLGARSFSLLLVYCGSRQILRTVHMYSFLEKFWEGTIAKLVGSSSLCVEGGAQANPPGQCPDGLTGPWAEPRDISPRLNCCCVALEDVSLCRQSLACVYLRMYVLLSPAK